MTIAAITAILSTASTARVGEPAVTGSGDDMAAEPVRARSSSTGELRRLRELRTGILDRRRATWRHEDELELRRTTTRHCERRTGAAYLRWCKRLWTSRADRRWRLRVELRDSSEAAIRFVFGAYAAQAIAVARCESGQSMTPRAHNGQYLGMFQMGSSERATYGHGASRLEQARAAHRYFVASGRDWSPWSCRWAAR